MNEKLGTTRRLTIPFTHGTVEVELSSTSLTGPVLDTLRAAATKGADHWIKELNRKIDEAEKSETPMEGVTYHSQGTFLRTEKWDDLNVTLTARPSTPVPILDLVQGANGALDVVQLTALEMLDPSFTGQLTQYATRAAVSSMFGPYLAQISANPGLMSRLTEFIK